MKKYKFICLLLLTVLATQIKARERLFFVPRPILPDTIHQKPASVILFAPGELPDTSLISLAPAFTSDGNLVFLGQSPGSRMSIVVSNKIHGKWHLPKIAPFSGKYNDLELALVPDGKYLIFASSRPLIANRAELEGKYNGQSYPGAGGNLWRVNIDNIS
jgi:hypothetical protein